MQALLACAHRVMAGQPPTLITTRLLPPPDEEAHEDEGEELKAGVLRDDGVSSRKFFWEPFESCFFLFRVLRRFVCCNLGTLG